MGARVRGGRLRKAVGVFRRWPIHPQWLRDPRQTQDALVASLSELHGVVVDIGCAGGGLGMLLPAGCTYLGIDYPTTATNLYATRPAIYADGAAIPLQDQSVDAVIFKDVLEHIEQPDAALAEAARVLRDEGRALIWIPFLYPIHDAPHDYQRFTEHGLSARLHRLGFRVDSMDTVGTPVENGALLFCLALADAMEQIASKHRSLWPIVPLLACMVVVLNLTGKALSWLPSTRFMPSAYRVVARRVAR